MNRHNTFCNARPQILMLAVTAAVAVPLTLSVAYADAQGNNLKVRSEQQPQESQQAAIIQVTAAPGESSVLKTPVSTGALGNASVIDTPFSIGTVTQKYIQDKQITTARDLFAGDASVGVRSTSYSNFGSQFSVRGISNGWEAHINELPVSVISQEAQPEMFEQVDVLKGATGFMYGFNTPGGTINYRTKRPTEETMLEATAGYLSNGVFSQAIDAGGRAGAEDRLGFRVNLVNETGSLPVGDARISRQAVGLALDARLTPQIMVYANVIQGRRYIKNPFAESFDASELIAAGEPLPDPISLSHEKVWLGDGQTDDRTLFLQSGVEWHIAENWRLQTDYALHKNNERFVSPQPELLSQNGDYTMFVYENKVFASNHIFQSVLQGEADTGTISHKLNTGFSNRIYKEARSPDALFDIVGSGNIFQPAVVDYHKQALADPFVPDIITERAAFISDRIVFNENWQLLAGIRHIRYQSASPGDETYNKRVNTPTLALIFKPEPATSFYASYAEALEEGSIVGEKYKNAGMMLPPLKSKQYELGMKTDQTRWSGTAAVFRIQRGAEYASTDNVLVQDGEERYQGLEVNANLMVSKNLDLSASAIWLEPTLRNVAPGSDFQGNRIAGVSRLRSAVEFGWIPDSLPDLRVSLRWRHEGDVTVDKQATLRIPAHDLLDLYVNYDTDALNHTLTTRFGVTNLTNKKYWSAGFYDEVYVGEPRTFMTNVSIRF